MTHDDCIAELPALLTGELGRDGVYDVVAHLRGCADCRTEFVELAAAHGALAAARRTLAVPAFASSEAPDQELPLPPLDPPPGALARRRIGPRGGTGPRRWVAGVAAAAAVALVAGGVVVGRAWTGGSGPGRPSAVRQAALVAVGQEAPSASGVVRMSGPTGRTDMTIRTSGLPPAGAGHFYYAWLLDPATNKMLPLGVVAIDASSTFEVQSDLVARYRAVDISLQADDGNPAHSPVSVLRATYA